MRKRFTFIYLLDAAGEEQNRNYNTFSHIIYNKDSQTVWYLCLLQQVDCENQPVRTAGFQLQGDEGQGQHGSSELQDQMRDDYLMTGHAYISFTRLSF